MEETPESPSPQPAPTWSITRSEWGGLVSRSQRHLRLWVPVGLTAMTGALFVGVALTLPSLPELPLLSALDRSLFVAGGLAIAVSIYLFFWLRRSNRRWNALHGEIWEAEGCVCPWCRERVDATPCRKHGFTRAEHPLLVRYWESMALKDVGGISEASRALLLRRRRTTMLSRAASVITSPFLKYVAIVNADDATPLQRLRAALPSIAVQYAVVLVLGFAVWCFAGRSALLATVSGCWWFFLIVPIMVMAGPIWKVGKLRCTKCGQLCASDRPTFCPECGSNLTLPAAVSRTERRGGPWRFALAAAPALFILGVPPLVRSVVAILPLNARTTMYAWTRPPYDYFSSLTPATMTQAEVDAALEVLIACAGPDGPKPLYESDFLKNALALGKVTPETAERAARAVVEATLEVAREGDALVATVTPRFGELVFGLDRAPRLVFGGISLDGGRWTPPDERSLSAHNLDPFHRGAAKPGAHVDFVARVDFAARVDLAARADFTAREDDAPPDARAVRARCWIVVWGPSWEPYRPEFDERGELVPPPGALVYPLELSATVDDR